MAFVDAFSTTTGRPHRVPEHFIDDPILGRDLTLTPPDNAQLDEAPPTEKWTIAQLTEYAAAHDIDLGGATVKADILTAVTTPTSTTGTPATGEGQE